MLDVCFNFSICNDIIFNPVKSVCVAVQHKKSKLFCPNVTLDKNDLEYIGRTKYLGCMLNSNTQDDEDMRRQMCNLYIRSTKFPGNNRALGNMDIMPTHSCRHMPLPICLHLLVII